MTYIKVVLLRGILITRIKNQITISVPHPANNCLFKVNNRNTTKRCEICSKLTIKTPEPRQ